MWTINMSILMLELLLSFLFSRMIYQISRYCFLFIVRNYRFAHRLHIDLHSAYYCWPFSCRVLLRLRYVKTKKHSSYREGWAVMVFNNDFYQL